MSNIEFDADQQFRRQAYASQLQRNSGRGMAGWLVKKGIIKDESQASGIFVIVIVINCAIAAFLIYKFVL